MRLRHQGKASLVLDLLKVYPSSLHTHRYTHRHTRHTRIYTYIQHTHVSLLLTYMWLYIRMYLYTLWFSIELFSLKQRIREEFVFLYISSVTYPANNHCCLYTNETTHPPMGSHPRVVYINSNKKNSMIKINPSFGIYPFYVDSNFVHFRFQLTYDRASSLSFFFFLFSLFSFYFLLFYSYPSITNNIFFRVCFFIRSTIWSVSVIIFRLLSNRNTPLRQFVSLSYFVPLIIQLFIIHVP